MTRNIISIKSKMRLGKLPNQNNGTLSSYYFEILKNYLFNKIENKIYS